MKRILLIHPEGNINSNPNLTGIVQILCESGYEVEIVSPRRPEVRQEPPCRGAGFRLIDFPNFSHALYYGFAVPYEVIDQPELLSARLEKSFGGADLVIGVDRGVIDASIISESLDVPFGLISYEIYSAEEIGPQFKGPEIMACRGISFAVCQDRVRSALLSRQNRIPLEKIIDIPVAGRGFRPSKGRAFRLHELLGLSRETRIALYIGCIESAWSMSRELISTVPDWPEDWALMLHHRYGTSFSEKLLSDFPLLRDSRKVFPSPFGQLDFDDLPQMLHDADLGLAFYVPQKNDFTAGNNLRYIGMASGKTATYLQHDLPIMVNANGLLSETVEGAGIGCVIGDASEIPARLAGLTREKLHEYRSNIRAFFETRLDLDVTIRPFLKRLDELLGDNKKTTTGTAGTQGRAFGETESETKEIKVSAIVSTYNSERFIRGCLEDLLDQTLYKKGELEIIVVNSGSQQNEEAIVKEFRDKYRNIVYLHTEREPLYAAWNRGIRSASGKYITNANTDDRHRRDALELMADLLDRKPEIGLVYGDVIITETENETFERHTPAGFFKWTAYDRQTLAVGCCVGPQPMWRRYLHQRHGFFDESFSTSGDWEFWLRVAETSDFFHIPEFLGLYLRSAGSLERANTELKMKENREVYRRYIPRYLPGYEKYFERLLSDFSDPVSAYRYGQILAALGRYDEAIGVYEEYLRKNPSDKGFPYLLQDIRMLKAMHLPPETAAPLPAAVMDCINRADAHMANGDLAAAREDIELALSHAAGHPQLSGMLSGMLDNLRSCGAADKPQGAHRGKR